MQGEMLEQEQRQHKRVYINNMDVKEYKRLLRHRARVLPCHPHRHTDTWEASKKGPVPESPGFVG